MKLPTAGQIFGSSCRPGLGMKEQAIQQLIKAFDEGSYYMIHLKVEPILDPLRADPRFMDIMRRVGH